MPAVQLRGKAGVALSDVLVRDADSTGISIEGSSPVLTGVRVQGANGPAFSATIGATPTLDQLAEEWKDIDPRSRDERLGRARNLRDGYIDGPTVQHPVWAWRWGDAVIVGHPGEAYSRLQTTLRERFPATPIVVMNLTNGPGFVYLPTREAYDRGAYQAWQTPLAAGALELLEAHAVTLVASLLDD